VGDPKPFMVMATDEFMKFPHEIYFAAVKEIAARSHRPSLRIIREVLEELYAPIHRQEERDNKARLLPAFVPHKRTPEEQARVDEQVATARRALGIGR